MALLGCTEADMDFWCWRGRAAETAAEAEAVEARDPGMVRLGDKSSEEAWVRGGWEGGRRLRLGSKGRAERLGVRGGERAAAGAGQVGSGQVWGAATGLQSERRKAGLGSGGRVRRVRQAKTGGGNRKCRKADRR